MNFNLKQIEAFIWVADLGSFRKAASRLNTTQPNISARISSLEAALGAHLMERDAGSVRLTSQGKELLKYARKVLRSTEELAAASGKNSLFQGSLKLGVTEMVVHTWLREFLRELKEHYPNIAVELTVDVSVNLEKELMDRSIDLALQNEPFVHQTSGSEDLGTYPLIWVASPDMGLHKKKEVTKEDLAIYPILTHAKNTRLYEEVENHFSPLNNVRIVPSTNLSACLHMTADGMGVVTVPEVMVQNELASGELVKINYSWTPESLHFLARFDAERSSGLVSSAATIAGNITKLFGTSRAHS
ncbi:LysR family transcriptional regulator [Leucothrix pacifica]|uniref:LysR family transcriptional regulator n=1 Tax=Leucothrix pacifica TaxID=1247513 RepID=A0A317CNZ7_9GAMM|nr:LysR family transcriptional regulator [Leucothrix pacifica]PWQ99213.1 LysR family transcriptional regulator [Leucothrix pacifica]